MIILDIDTTLNFTHMGGSITFTAYFRNADYVYADQVKGGE